MEDLVLFYEMQKFKQWWLWLILITVNCIFLNGVIKQMITGRQFGDTPMTNFQLILTTSIVILITILFTILRLETEIRPDAIYVRFFPFHLSFKRYVWQDLQVCYVRRYNAITEYGGWGIRLGILGKGRALNVSGDQGLQLEFVDGKKLLIGTHRPEELTQVLSSLRQLKHGL